MAADDRPAGERVADESGTDTRVSDERATASATVERIGAHPNVVHRWADD